MGMVMENLESLSPQDISPIILFCAEGLLYRLSTLCELGLRSYAIGFRLAISSTPG